MSIDKIARKIQELIDDETRKGMGFHHPNWKERYDWVKSFMTSKVSEAQQTYDYFKNEGFSASSIEAEGYLRASKEALDMLKTIEEDLPIGENNDNN